MNEINVKFSSRARTKWFISVLILLFLGYYLVTGFIEDYFFFDKVRSSGFYFSLLILAAGFFLISLFIMQLLKKAALSIRENEIIIYYYMLGSYFIPLSRLQVVTTRLHKNKRYLSFKLDNSEEFLESNPNPISKIFLLKYLNKNKNELLIPSDDLAVDTAELIAMIIARKGNDPFRSGVS